MYDGQKCAFLRCHGEHHSMGLFPISFRERFGFSSQTSSMSFGVQFANYQQLKDAGVDDKTLAAVIRGKEAKQGHTR